MGAAIDPVIMIDCRYLGSGGAGRVTELLLRGLTALQPEGRFVLWGPEEVQGYLWPAATWHPSFRRPTASAGQRELFRVPRHDVALFLHQIRPLRPGRSLTTIYDTIPLRHGGSVRTRSAKRLYLRTVARLSTRIATLSRYSASCIERDLGVPQDKIAVIGYPVDEKMRDRVEALRQELPAENAVLFVGRFAPHKNLPRLIEAFPKTSVGAEGGRLILVGGTAHEIDELGRWAGRESQDVELRPPCSQAELEHLFATSRLLVMPSVEEGYGLPAWEAAICGLRVCVSDIPAFREILPEAPRFDPADIDAIATTIDQTLTDLPSPPPQGTTPESYAATFVGHAAALSP